MARGRPYSVGFSGVSVSAVQDLFSLLATANMAFEIHFIKLGQITQTTIGGLRVRLRRLPATVTVGSGGTAVTPAALLPSDGAATVTARVNDTTQASTSGTAVDLPDTWDLPGGFLWMPPEADRPIIRPSQGFIVSLDTTPGAALTVSGHMVFAELF